MERERARTGERRGTCRALSRQRADPSMPLVAGVRRTTGVSRFSSILAAAFWERVVVGNGAGVDFSNPGTSERESYSCSERTWYQHSYLAEQASRISRDKLSDLCITYPSTMRRVENNRHVLPIGRCESHEAVGSLCRILAHPHVANGIMIAPVFANGKSEEAFHDDF